MLPEAESRARVQAMRNSWEQRVNTLLLDFGMDAVDFNARILNTANQEIGEIDGLFSFDGHLMMVETTAERDVENDSVVAWFSKWEDRANINRVLTQYHLSPRMSHRLYFWLSRRRPDRLSPNVERVLQDRTNRIIFLDEVERYEENLSIVGRWERNNFLNFLEIQREAIFRSIPAILFYVSDKPAYAFSLSADKLLEVCYVSRRYKNELGFQRAIDKKRIDKIRRAIERKEFLTFPNSILINSLSVLCSNKPPRETCPTNVTVNLPQDYSSCKVIDGQHRLLGFSRVNAETARAYNLAVVAFEGLSNREEADTFVVINSEQKKVDANLVLLLKSDSEWPQDSDFFLQKVAVDVVKKLEHSSHLRGRIYMGYADQERADTWVTLATLVRAMIQNKFVAQRNGLFQSDPSDTETPYRSIREIFATMARLRFPYFVGSADRFFLSNKGLRILFRFVHLYHRNFQANNISVTIDEVLQLLAANISPAVKRDLQNYYGEGGAKRAVEQLVETLRGIHPDFRNFATDFRRV
jgi:DGQHR domain-containing protein